MSNDKKITLNVVVAGTPTEVDTNTNAPLNSVASKALAQTHQTERDLTKWELTTVGGQQLNYNTKVGDAGLKDKDTVLLNLHTGVTG